MSTIDHGTITESGEADRPADLSAWRSRRRLEHLLDVRSRLASLAVERRCHGLEDHLDIYGQQMAVEAVIAEEFRETFDEGLPRWVDQEARAEHEPPAIDPACGICQAISARAGINLTPPEAA